MARRVVIGLLICLLPLGAVSCGSAADQAVRSSAGASEPPAPPPPSTAIPEGKVVPLPKDGWATIEGSPISVPVPRFGGLAEAEGIRIERTKDDVITAIRFREPSAEVPGGFQRSLTIASAKPLKPGLSLEEEARATGNPDPVESLQLGSTKAMFWPNAEVVPATEQMPARSVSRYLYIEPRTGAVVQITADALPSEAVRAYVATLTEATA